MNKSPFFPIVGKKPKVKWKEVRTPFNELNEHESLGFVPPSHVVIIDADTKSATKHVEHINELLNIEPISYPTSRGKHFIYKKPKGDYFDKLVSQVDVSLFGDPSKNYRGSKIDLKSSSKLGKAGYVKVKSDNKWRIPVEKLLEVTKEDYELPDLPLSLAITPKFKFSLDEYIDGARDEYIFKKIVPFRAWTEEQFVKFCVELKLLAADEEDISETIEWAKQKWNSSKRMGDVEIPILTDGNISDNPDDYLSWIEKKYGKDKNGDKILIANDVVNLPGLAEEIIKDTQLQFSLEDSQIWGIENGEFVPITKFDLFLKRWLINKYANIKPQIFATVKNYIEGAIPVKTFYNNQYAIKFKNKIIDISTNSEITVPDGQILNNLIPHNLISKEELETTHKEAKEFLDKIMLDWTKKRKKLIKQIYEMVGVSMSKYTKKDKAYFLVGTGSNGKSIFLELLIRLFGVSNISNEDLKELSEDRFSLANLHSKLVNINPDISADVIQDTSLFKRIVSGDYVAAAYKGKDKFTFKPYATFIFGANNIPHPRERGDSDAINRRVEIIPFQAKFDENRIPEKKKIEFIKKISDNKVVEVLAYYAVEAVINALENGWTISSISKKKHDDFVRDVNHMYNFVSQRKAIYKPDEMQMKVYNEYRTWADRYGYAKLGFGEFSKKYINAMRNSGILIEMEHRGHVDGDQADRFIQVGVREDAW